MTSSQNSLFIKKGSLCIISVFNLNLANITPNDFRIALHPSEKEKKFKTLSSIIPNCNQVPDIPIQEENTLSNHLCSCFHSGDEFLNITDSTNSFYCERHHVKSFSLINEDKPPLQVHVLLTTFPKRNIALLEYCIPVENISDAEFINLKHRFYEPPTSQGSIQEILSHEEDTIILQDYRGIMKDLCHQIIKEICQLTQSIITEDFTPKDTSLVELSNPPLIFTHELSEIQDIGLESNSTIEELTQKYSQNLYGLLTSDEGYKFVPTDLALKRLKNHWGSRKFTTSFVFGKSILVINLKNSSFDGQQYMEMQLARKGYTPSRKNYFKMCPCIAGLDHGTLVCTERSVLLFFELKQAHNRLNSKIESKELQTIIQLHENRQSIIHLLSESQHIISEINELFLLICRENRVLEFLDEIKFHLNLKTEDLSFSYQERNDQLIKRLTIITAVISTLSIFSNMLINYSQNLEGGFCGSQLILHLPLILCCLSVLAAIIYFIVVFILYRYKKIKATKREKLEYKYKKIRQQLVDLYNRQINDLKNKQGV